MNNVILKRNKKTFFYSLLLILPLLLVFNSQPLKNRVGADPVSFSRCTVVNDVKH
jgi:hypothetical protein